MQDDGLWLTRVVYPKGNKHALSMIEDGQISHWTSMEIVPEQVDDLPRKRANILHRVEMTKDKINLLVQTTIEPSNKKPTFAEQIENRNISKEISELENGSTVKFRLDLNAVKQRTEDGGRSIRRKIDAEEAESFVYSALLRCGIDVMDIDWNSERRRVGKSTKRDIGFPLDIMCISGIGKIVSRDSLKTAVTEGIGKGKAYGCGLLSIKSMQF